MEISVLGFAFFTSIFSTFSWLIFSLIYISDKLTGISSESLGVSDLMVYLCMTLLPILVIWLIFGYVLNFSNARTNAKNFQNIFSQAKKNQDYSDLIARALIECEQNIRSGFILNKFDIFVVDLNELLSEIISRCKIISEGELQDAWARIENGGKWFLGKLIIEANRKRSDFSAEIIRRAEEDSIVEGTILEFCARYQSLVALLEKHDKERLLLEIVETGVLGKVFSIIAPVADKIRKNREKHRGFFFGKSSSESSSSSSKQNSDSLRRKEGLFSKVFKKVEKEFSVERAERNEPVVDHSFEKDFGADDHFSGEKELKRPSFFDTPRKDNDDFEFPELEGGIDIDEIETPEEKSNTENFFQREPVQKEPKTEEKREPSITEKAMDDLKKDWESFENLEKVSSPQERKIESRREPTLGNLSSELEEPFGKWADEDNYKK